MSDIVLSFNNNLKENYTSWRKHYSWMINVPSAFLNTVIFGHHVLMCGSTTRGLNFSPIFWISNIWPKMRRISNIEQNFRSSQYPYVHKNRSIFTGKIDFVAQRNWFATFVAKYIHVIHFFYKGEFHFESWLKRIIQHKKRRIKEERQIIYTKYKKTVALVIVNVRTKYLTNNQQQI